MTLMTDCPLVLLTTSQFLRFNLEKVIFKIVNKIFYPLIGLRVSCSVNTAINISEDFLTALVFFLLFKILLTFCQTDIVIY